MNSSPLQRFSTSAAVAAVSGAAWLTSWELNELIFKFAKLPGGPTLIYLPAGVCLIVILIAGFAGAAGITFAFPFALVQVIPTVSVSEMIVYSLVAGLVPYFVAQTLLGLSSIGPDLTDLRSRHLPALGAAIALVTATTASLAFAAFGRTGLDEFFENTAAKAAGDFLGCFLVIFFVRLAIVVGRALRR